MYFSATSMRLASKSLPSDRIAICIAEANCQLDRPLLADVRLSHAFAVRGRGGVQEDLASVLIIGLWTADGVDACP